MASNVTSGFVIFADIEAYSRRNEEDDIEALTVALCRAAVTASGRVGWSDVRLQCTGDGFVAAPPPSAKAAEVIDFLRYFTEIFNPVGEGGSLKVARAKIRWGIDRDSYHQVDTFESKNIVGLAPIAAARLGSLGDGDHILMSARAHDQLKSALGKVRDLGDVEFKHGFSLQVFQDLHVGSSELPRKIKGRAETMVQVHHALKRLALEFVTTLVECKLALKRDGTAQAIAESRRLRASLLLPYKNGRYLRVPSEQVEEDDRAPDGSPFRAVFGSLERHARAGGRTEFPLDEPKGVPGTAFSTRLIQAMTNLPRPVNGDLAAYVRAATGVEWRRYGYTVAEVKAWTRHAQNFVSVPVVTAGRDECVGVLSFDFDKALKTKSAAGAEITEALKDRFANDRGRVDLGLLAILVSLLRG